MAGFHFTVYDCLVNVGGFWPENVSSGFVFVVVLLIRRIVFIRDVKFVRFARILKGLIDALDKIVLAVEAI